MNVLVINCGSSSLKFQLIDSVSEKVLAKGLCERIGIDGSKIEYEPYNGEEQEKEVSMPTHNEAIKIVIDSLLNKETGVIKDLSEVGAVGHRVVHGGEYFQNQLLSRMKLLRRLKNVMIWHLFITRLI